MRPLQENYDYITICKTGTNQKRISSKSDFINGQMIVKIDVEKIVFKRAGIDYNGKSYLAKPNKKTKYIHIGVIVDLPTGKFYFDDDDSNEDIKVVYFN